MVLLRYGVALVLATCATACEVGAPQRASHIQNVNAISDDIAAVRMTQSPSSVSSPNSDTGSVKTYTPLLDYRNAPER
ncbi:MAG: hypothetical protein AB7H71_12805 [Alphaproteobacteria bacterium]